MFESPRFKGPGWNWAAQSGALDKYTVKAQAHIFFSFLWNLVQISSIYSFTYLVKGKLLCDRCGAGHGQSAEKRTDMGLAFVELMVWR